MPKNSLLVLPDFLEEATLLPKETRSKLFRILHLLSEDFRHPSLQCKKVKGSRAPVYECRVDQGIRLIYDVLHGGLRCWYVGEHDAALSFAVALRPESLIAESPRTNSLQKVGPVPVDDIEVAEMEAEDSQGMRIEALQGESAFHDMGILRSGDASEVDGDSVPDDSLLARFVALDLIDLEIAILQQEASALPSLQSESVEENKAIRK